MSCASHVETRSVNHSSHLEGGGEHDEHDDAEHEQGRLEMRVCWFVAAVWSGLGIH